MNSQNDIKNIFSQYIDEQLISGVFSRPVKKDGGNIRCRVRRIMVKGTEVFQFEEFIGKQTFHKNLSAAEAVLYAASLTDIYHEVLLTRTKQEVHLLISKKGAVTTKIRRTEAPVKLEAVSHNRQKEYLLAEGTAVPFLVDLGVMTKEGAIVNSRYDKFRQINRFLEFIHDILPEFSNNKIIRIIDFGCGKSYLTFAVYHYLHEVLHREVDIIGLDLKEDVITRCSQLASRYGYENLRFLCGDIAGYEQTDEIDMVITLHACDTATDYALAKAAAWNAKVILSVPCCQHELNRQLDNEWMQPILSYGILKDRMAALFTDGLRAQILEGLGYRTQILEFIDMEHTPKNLLIRAVRTGKRKNNQAQIDEICRQLNVTPTLKKLCCDSESPLQK